jgi:hypothetical protein
MKLLRASPESFSVFARALHAFILSCCELVDSRCGLVDPAAAVAPLKHSDMKLLRASPFSFSADACALQLFIRCCCELDVAWLDCCPFAMGPAQAITATSPTATIDPKARIASSCVKYEGALFRLRRRQQLTAPLPAARG